MTDLERLWRVPVYLPYLQPALTKAAIEEAEAHLGVRLPRTYLAALQIQNGGYLRATNHPSGHAPVRDLMGIGPRYPSILERDWGSVKATMKEEGHKKPARIDDLIAFSGDGHYFYCFDYRKSGRDAEPAVAYIDVETFGVDKVLAPDFDTFLGQLTTEPSEPVYGLVTDAPAKEVAAALSKATGVKFADQGDQDHGYTVYRAKLPGDASWAWLSANRVRRGFVRKTDRDFKKVRDWLPEMVDRFPEHRDCAFFLSCSDFGSKAGKAIVKSLEELPYEVKSLRLDE